MCPVRFSPGRSASVILYKVARRAGTLVAWMPLEISHKEVTPGVVVLTLTGKLMLRSDGQDIPKIVEDCLRQGTRTFVFDLSGVTVIDSTGIGRFIASYNKIAGAGGEMRMAGATGHLFQSFHVGLLHQVFPFFPTTEEAVRG